jgi:protein tyrosine phosphatase (PTP) superfamily phosphohydrolase (DUF442 family)
MSDAYRSARQGIRPTKEPPTEPAMPPSVAGVNQAQMARLSLEVQQRQAQALEDIRDIVRASAEAMAPVLVAIAQGLGPAMAQATKDLRELGEKILAALEHSPLDTPRD